MLAKLENGSYNLYNKKDVLIGKITPLKDLKQCEIIIADKHYELFRESSTMKIFEQDELLYNLKTSFYNNIEILETNFKIKGVSGQKWGTQLVDKENQTLLKIKNKNLFAETNQYVIETSTNQLNPIDILMALYGHLYGSKNKQQIAIIVAVVTGILVSRIFI